MTESRELAELRYHWGEAYQLAVWGGGWRAKRRAAARRAGVAAGP